MRNVAAFWRLRVFGLGLLIATPLHEDARFDILYAQMPLGVLLIVAGFLLVVTQKVAPEDFEKLGKVREERRVEADGATHEARARLLLALLPAFRSKFLAHFTAQLELEIDDAGVRRLLTTEVEVAPVNLVRLVPGASIPILVQDDDPERIKVDWHRWDREMRLQPSI